MRTVSVPDMMFAPVGSLPFDRHPEVALGVTTTDSPAGVDHRRPDPMLEQPVDTTGCVANLTTMAPDGGHLRIDVIGYVDVEVRLLECRHPDFGDPVRFQAFVEEFGVDPRFCSSGDRRR